MAIPPTDKEEYLQFIKKNRKKFFPYAVKEIALLKLMINEGFITKKDINDLLSLVKEENVSKQIIKLIAQQSN